jgi:CRISPR-associated protein Cas6/Cse3/CasE, subtype I-E/ECOLI
MSIDTASLKLQSACLPQAVSNELLLLKGPKEIHFELKSGGRYRFMLCANPTKRINDKDGKTENQGKVRVPIIDEAEVIAWLKRQFEGSAEIDALELNQKNLIHFRKTEEGQVHFGKIQTVTFLGILTVINSELLLGKITEGIGPAKAFGCGLLTLAKV